MCSLSNDSTTEALPYVKQNEITGQLSLYAARSYTTSEVIVSFCAASRLSQPTYQTIQIGDQIHIALSPAFLQYVNHSCAPNSFFDTMTMQFVALKDIQPDTELCFFYPSTEWQMAQAFVCHCNNENCLGAIQGAAFLSKAIAEKYRFTDYIISRLLHSGLITKP